MQIIITTNDKFPKAVTNIEVANVFKTIAARLTGPNPNHPYDQASIAFPMTNDHGEVVGRVCISMGVL